METIENKLTSKENGKRNWKNGTTRKRCGSEFN